MGPLAARTSNQGDYEMKVLAKDAKAGQWYKDRNGAGILCVGGNRFVREVGDVFGLWSNEELTHLPDCTGWDWQPPKPEKKYRPFANAAEFAPHRDRWVKYDGMSGGFLFRITGFSDSGARTEHDGAAYKKMLEIAFFDDGTPFGVEVAE